MAEQTFEIINGVYGGPSVYPEVLDLRKYKDTLTSLGSLKEVRGVLDLDGCTSLTSLGSLTRVGVFLYLEGCTSLTSLGSLTEVGSWLDLRGCTSLTSLGSLKEVGESVLLGGYLNTTLQEVQEKILYYSSLPLHEALNALHTEEVQEAPLYKNILLQTLQGG